MPSKSMRAKIIRVKIDEDGDMFFATSPDMKGLLVAATSLEKMDAAVLKAIRNMYLACDIDVFVSKAEDGSDAFEPWVAFPAELARQALA
jgi:hypothetical protein